MRIFYPYLIALGLTFPALAAGPPGGTVSGFLADPANPAVLYAWSDGAGVFKSIDSGANWTGLNTGLEKSVKTLALSRSGIFFAGTARGVYKTVNAGQTWYAAGSALAPYSIPALAMDSGNAAVVYAGTANAGVFKSLNGGANWTAINNGLTTREIQALAIDPTNPATVWAGTFFGGRLFKTTNGGANWSQSTNGYTDMFVSGIYFAPTDPRTMYVFGRGVSKSTDGGASWKPCGEVPVQVVALAVDPENAATLYAGGGIPPDRGSVFRSRDGGTTWEPALIGLTAAAVRTLLVDPERSTTVYAGTAGDGVFQSLDRGDSWRRTVPGFGAASVTALAVSNGVVVAASGSRLYRSGDLGVTWMDCGYPGWTPTSLVASISGAVLVGAFDNIWRGNDTCAVWQPLMATGPMLNPPAVQTIAVDPVTPANIYVGTQVEGIRKTPDGGSTWLSMNTGGPQGQGFSALAIDPSNPRIVYAGTSTGPFDTLILKSADSGITWGPASGGLPVSHNGISAILVSPASSSVLCAGAERAIYRSTNGGISWTPVAYGPTTTTFAGRPWLRALAADPSKPSTFYAATETGILKSTNGGATWTAANQGLPSLDIVSIAVGSGGTVYAGTADAGVFGSTNAAANWAPTGMALANPVPMVSAVTPSTLAAGSGPTVVMISGSAFLPVSVARWNGFDRPTTFVNGTQLMVTITAEDLKTAGSGQLNVFTPGPGGGTSGAQTVIIGGPVVSAAGVVNAASMQGSSVAPGEIVTIFGTGLGPQAMATHRLTAEGLFDTRLASTRILFDGTPAPLVYVSDGQSAAIVPYAAARATSVKLQIEVQGGLSQPVTIPVVPAAPGIFTADSSGSGQAAALNEDGSPNSTVNPAAAGSVIVLYATGEGQTTPAGCDGKPANAVLPKPAAAVSVSIGGRNAEILYAGAAPGLVAGVMQVNARIPAETAGGHLPVRLSVGSAVSREVTIAVK